MHMYFFVTKEIKSFFKSSLLPVVADAPESAGKTELKGVYF